MRLFNVATVGKLQIETVTLTGGNTTSGGAIANNGELTLVSVAISGNEAASSGGGIYNLRGQLTITNSSLRNNRAQVGGGIYSFGTQAVLRITGTTIRENVATSIAGGIFNFDGDAQINTSVIRQNTANVKGGGVQNANAGVMRIFDSNITENNATSFGGGVSSDSPNLTANRNCIFANVSPTGSNAYRDVNNGVALDMRNNWWGRNTGPIGSEVVGNINFVPVLNSRPTTTCPASSPSGGPVTEEK